MKQKFDVTGMTCSACSAHVEKAVRQVPGVEQVNVNLLGNSMLVEYGEQADPAGIIRAVEAAGYGASLPRDRAGAPPARRGPGVCFIIAQCRGELLMFFCVAEKIVNLHKRNRYTLCRKTVF